MAQPKAVLIAGSVVAASLAVAGASVSHGSGGQAVTNRGVESAVVSVATTLAAIGVLAAVGLLLIWLRRARSTPAQAELKRRHPWWVQILALGVALALVVAVWAPLALSAHGHPHPGAAAAAGGPPPPEVGRAAVAFNSAASGLTVGLVALLVLAAVLYRRSRRSRTPFRHLSPTPAVAPSPEPADASVPCATQPDFSTPPDPRTERDPRRSVVLAYQQFIAVMSRAGMPRLESETPIEFASRLGSTVSGDASAPGQGRGPQGDIARAAGRLTALFNLARYGSGYLDETDRIAAIEYVDAVEHAIGAPS